MNKYSVVTVAHQIDYDALCLQARSMAKYLPASLVEQIIVVGNPKIDGEKHLLDQYGALRKYVTFVAGSDIAPPETFKRSGWFSQQVLKLLIAQNVKTPRYLVLDAKNTLVSPLTTKFLETWRGKPRSFWVDFTKHTSIRWLRNTLSYFSLPEAKYAQAFMPTTTPFVLMTDLVKEMIKYVEKRDGTSFTAAFYKHDLTEFFIYAGYLISTKKMSYDFSGQECKTVWDCLHDDHYVKGIIAQTKQHKLPFFSVHRRAVPHLSPSAKTEILDFWKSRGLDGSSTLI